jgi:hypothetical protein
LKPALDRSFAPLGVPESITHDDGPPYFSGDRKFYAKEGFLPCLCTPEHPEGNGIAERFMGVLVKTVHTAVAENKDPVVELQRRLLNYCITPHPSTGKMPSELMMGKQIRTKVPMLLKPAQGRIHEEAKMMDRQTRLERKEIKEKEKTQAKQDHVKASMGPKTLHGDRGKKHAGESRKVRPGENQEYGQVEKAQAQANASQD